MSRFLITGGAGFIGSALTRGLLAKGADRVVIVDNLLTGHERNLDEVRGQIDFHRTDIRDYDGVLAAMSGIDVVFHEAAIPSVPRSINDPVPSHEVNINGTFNVLRAAKEAGARRVVYAASSSAYGDSLTLPNGVTRDFRSRLGSVDARGDERLDKKEGMVQGDSDKGGDARTVGEGAATGAGIGAVVGAAAGHAGMGAGIGGAAGAAAGLAGVLLTRGPDAVLAKGSTVEMVLDRPLVFDAGEVNFTTMGEGARFSDGAGPAPANKSGVFGGPARRLAF